MCYLYLAMALNEISKIEMPDELIHGDTNYRLGTSTKQNR